MRRKDREKDSNFALELLKECEYATVAMTGPDATPYCIPVSPVLVENTLYFHCAKEGKKLDYIRLNPNVCISCVGHYKVVPEKYTAKYKSAVAFGVCLIVEDDREIIMALREICKKYVPENMDRLSENLDRWLAGTCVCKIEIIEATGKENE